MHTAASIRPRPGGRGDTWCIGYARPGLPMLQFGHDPEAVETSAGTSIRPTAHMRLQFGHDPEAVETSTRAPAKRQWRLQFGHDPEAVETRPAGDAQGAGRLTASIRPRPGGRGDVPRRPRFTALRTCFNSATTRRPWRQASAQCRAVERIRFNSATTRRPWRQCRSDQPSNWRPGLLQFGHDPEAVETRPLGTTEAAQTACRFNSATTRRPWRRRQAGRQTAERTVLQFGHDPEAVET